MFQDTRVFSFFRLQLISFSLLTFCATGLLFAAPRADVAHDVTACQEAVFLDDITWLDGRFGGRGQQVYALDLDQEGLLNVEATHLGTHPGQPRLEILDAHCRPLDTTFAIHRGHRAALVPSSETYYIKVIAPGFRATSEYRLQIAFASMSQLASLASSSGQEDEPTDPWEDFTAPQQVRFQTGTNAGPGQEDEPTDPWEDFTAPQQARFQTGTNAGPGQEDEPTDPWEDFTAPQQARFQTGTNAGPGQEDEPTDPWEDLTAPQQARFQTGTNAGPGQEDEPTDPWEDLTAPQQVRFQTSTTGGPGQEDEPTDPWEDLTAPQQARFQTGTNAGPGQEDEPTDPWEDLTAPQQVRFQTGTTGGPGQEDEPTDPWEDMVAGDSVDVLAAFADWRRSQTTSPWQSAQPDMNLALEAALCPRLSHGDDGDSLGCATEMLLGGQLQADMRHAELDDRDTYTFVLHQRAQVTLASRGDLDLRGMLYNAEGQQLAIDDEGSDFDDGADNGNFRLEATLDAGRYYLRVDSLDGYTGDYELLSAVTPEAWQVAANH